MRNQIMASFLVSYHRNMLHPIFKRGSVTRKFTIFEQNEVTIPLFIYKTILKHQEKEIHQVVKEEQVMVCSSPF